MGCEDFSHYYIRHLQTSSPTLVIIQYWEGNAAIEDIDRTGVNPRFMAMPTGLEVPEGTEGNYYRPQQGVAQGQVRSVSYYAASQGKFRRAMVYTPAE